MAVVTTDRVMKWGGSLVVTLGALWGFHEWLSGTHLPAHLITHAEAQSMRTELKGAVDAAKVAGDKATQASEAATEATVQVRIFLKQQEVSRLEGELSQTTLWESQNAENDVSRRLKRDLGERIAAAKRELACLLDAEAC